jgi:hypothetical protein
MKKVLLTFLCSNLIAISYSQSLTLTDTLTPVPNNGDLFISGTTDCLISRITVNNTTSSTLAVECKKAILQDVSGSMNYFTWGACYPPFTFAGNQAVEIPAYQSNSYNFSGLYFCQGNIGTAIIRYTFWVIGNPSDSVCFNVHYSACSVGINETEHAYGFFEPYPNPAKDYVSLRYSLHPGSQAGIELVTLQGTKVQCITADAGKGSTSICLSGLSQGIYYLLLKENGLIISRKKLVVD